MQLELQTVAYDRSLEVVVVVVLEGHLKRDRKMDLAVHPYEGQLGVVLEVQLEKDHGMHFVAHLTRVASSLVDVVVVVFPEAHVEQDRRMDLAIHAYESQLGVVLEVQLEMDHGINLDVTRVESFLVDEVVVVVSEAHVEQDRRMEVAVHTYRYKRWPRKNTASASLKVAQLVQEEGVVVVMVVNMAQYVTTAAQDWRESDLLHSPLKTHAMYRLHLWYDSCCDKMATANDGQAVCFVLHTKNVQMATNVSVAAYPRNYLMTVVLIVCAPDVLTFLAKFYV